MVRGVPPSAARNNYYCKVCGPGYKMVRVGNIIKCPNSDCGREVNIPNTQSSARRLRSMDPIRFRTRGAGIKTPKDTGSENWRVKSFKPDKNKQKYSKTDYKKEPVVDVFNEESEVVVTFELPGVSDENITVSLKDNKLTLETTGARSYKKDVDLDDSVSSKFTTFFKNGILTIKIEKNT